MNAEVAIKQWVPGTVHPTGGYDDVSYEPERDLYALGGVGHRLDGPAEITYRPRAGSFGSRVVQMESWLFQGEHHRLDGPAVTRYSTVNGEILSQWWMVDGQYHRADGPASVFYYPGGEVRGETYFLHGREHREDGPAIVEYRRFGGPVKRSSYALDGHEFATAEKWDRYREARDSGAPLEWALAYASGEIA